MTVWQLIHELMDIDAQPEDEVMMTYRSKETGDRELQCGIDCVVRRESDAFGHIYGTVELQYE